MQMEDEEDPWAGWGMDEAGETPPGISTNVESQAEDAIGPRRRAERTAGRDRRKWRRDRRATPEFTTRTKKAHGERDGKKSGGLPHGCSEPRQQQAEMRIADGFLTILAEAALENEQMDKAMEAMGIARSLKKEEDIVVARGEGAKFGTNGTGASSAARDFCRNFEDQSALPGKPPYLEHGLRHREKQEQIQPEMRGT